jgi:hypothetical protein
MAAYYRLTERALRDFVLRHNIPVLTTGKAIRFDRVARAALEEAMRRPRRSKSSDGKIPARSRSSGRSRVNSYEEVLSLARALSPKKKLPRLKPGSSEKCFT